MAEFVLELSDLRKSFGGICVTDGISLKVGARSLHALIGPNGAGKTTLINQISGLLQPDSGTVSFMGQDVTHLPVDRRAAQGLARSFQTNSIFPGFSVLENVAIAAQARSGSSFRFFGRAARERALNDRAFAALDMLGLAKRCDSIAGTLSHGEKRAVELAMALVTEPKLLLLDEPMAGTGPRESEMLVEHFLTIKGRFPIILVEHDMNAVFSLADSISVLIYGRVLASGAPDQVRADPQVIAAYLGEATE